jgi:hypothetical protein
MEEGFTRHYSRLGLRERALGPYLGRCHQAPERGAHAAHHHLPIAVTALPEQSELRIPGAIVALDEPAPIRHERHQHPDRLAERSRQVGRGSVDRDHHIEARDGGRGLRKIVKPVGKVGDRAGSRARSAARSGDFNGDGKSDILWQNSDGTPTVWEMNGTSIVSTVALPNPAPGWPLQDDGPLRLIRWEPLQRATVRKAATCI